MSTKETNGSRRLQHHTNATERKAILGSYNVFQRFAPNSLRRGILVSRKMEADKHFNFRRLRETEIEVQDTLQHPLLSPPILTISRPNGSYIPDTDASDEQYALDFLQ